MIGLGSMDEPCSKLEDVIRSKIHSVERLPRKVETCPDLDQIQSKTCWNSLKTCLGSVMLNGSPTRKRPSSSGDCQTETLEANFLYLDSEIKKDGKISRAELRKNSLSLQKKCLSMAKVSTNSTPSRAKKRLRCARTLIKKCDISAGASKDGYLQLNEWKQCLNPSMQINQEFNSSLIREILTGNGSNGMSTRPGGSSSENEDNPSGEKTDNPSFGFQGENIYKKKRDRTNNCHSERRFISDCHKYHKDTRRRRLSRSASIQFDSFNGLPLNPGNDSEDEDAPCSKEPIPACSKGNKKKWSKMQCDPGTQYCWCVSPKTGIYDDTYRVIQKDRQLKCRDDVISGCSRNFVSNVRNQLNENADNKIFTNPNIDQSSFIDNINNLEFIGVEVFFKLHDKNRRKGRHVGLGDDVWSPKEQRMARRDLNQIMEGIESPKCLRRLFTYCDSDHDKKIKKKEFMDCLDPSVIKKRKLTESDYKNYFKTLSLSKSG